MFCSRCGIQVVEGKRFCQACGQEVGAAVISTAAIAGAIPTPIAGTGRISGPLPYSGFWARLVAYLIDGLILGIPFGFVALFIIMSGVLGVTLHRKSVDPREAAALLGPMFLLFFLAFLVLVAVQWLYFAILESSEMSLRVTNYDGQRISFGHATGRFFAKIVSGMVPFAIGYIMAGFTEKKQALHDLIAGTLVLRK
jgi:uncharacterized RDD family membrane protein YckC